MRTVIQLLNKIIRRIDLHEKKSAKEVEAAIARTLVELDVNEMAVEEDEATIDEKDDDEMKKTTTKMVVVVVAQTGEEAV